jgi:thioredoxin-like negative regulator of GroEL
VTTGALDEAAALIKAGKMAEAQEILHPFIRANPQNVDAWLLETETWNTAGKLRVLEICLEHNPGNPRAQQALKDLLSAHQERMLRLTHRVRTLESSVDTRPRRESDPESAESLSAKFDRLTSELEKSRHLMEQVKQNFDRLQSEVDSLRKEMTQQGADHHPPQ